MSRRVDLGQVVPIKGQDYFTTAEIEQIESETKEQVKTELDFDNTISGIEQEISDLNSNKASKTELENEKTARELADTNLQSQIDAIESGKDVVDIVATYSDLQNYDTSTLTEDDVIKVLDDSTHNNAMSYYRWASNTWNYIGSEGPFYTRSETDERLNTKQPTIDSTHKLSSDLVDDTNQTNKFTSTNEKNTWNAKYDKPNTGIPKSDLVASVQESLNKADTAIQDVSDKEDKSNKVTEIDSSSTDTQYPSAKCVYNSQKEQNEHIAELEMLYNAFPTVSAENETIQLDNTAKVKFREIDLKGNTSQVVIPEEQGTSVSNTSIYVSDVDTDKENTIEMSGNTYQETTTGKSLFGGFTFSKTYNGITFTYNQNGSITVNGTATGDATSMMSSEARNNNYLVTLSPGTYTISCSDSNTTVEVIKSDGSFIANVRPSETSKIFTVSSEISVFVRINIASGTTINNITVFPMLEEGSTATDWEKYTGGNPAPNPDYPQNIEVVTGQNDITIYGKNLFNPTYEVETQYDINGNVFSTNRYTLNNNVITIDKSNNSYGNAFFNKINLSAGTYIFSCDVSQTNNTTNQARVKVQNWTNSTSVIASKSINISSGKVEETFTISSNGEIGIMLIPNQNSDGTLSLTNIQLEKSSTITTYEPYVSQTYPVNLGNIELCKISTYQDRIYKSNNKWYLEKNIDKVVLDGSENWTSAIASDGKRWICTSYDNALIPPDMNTIGKIISDTFMAISANSTANSINGIAIAASGRFVIYDEIIKNYSYTSEIKTWLSTHNTEVEYILATPTTTEITDTNLVNQLNALYNATIYPITNINTDTSNLLPYIDLHYNFVTPSPSPNRPSVVNVVKGNNTITISNSDNTESQNYPINLGDMELCKIGTYQDYIYESNGNWFKKGNIGKTTLNGTEDWTLTNNVLQSTNEMPSDIRAIGATMSAYSSHFEYHYYATSITTNIQSGEFGWNSGKKLTFKIDGFTTQQEYTNWLGNNNVSIYYQLATPTDTQITDTTLITQLNNIKKAYSYDTQTNISQTNTDKPFIIYAEAIRSLKDVFE